MNSTEWVLALLMLILEAVIVIQGVTLAIVLFRTKAQSNLYLGLVIIFFSINQLSEILTGYGLPFSAKPYGYFFALSYGPLFYFYILSYFGQSKINLSKSATHFLPALASLYFIVFESEFIAENSLVAGVLTSGQILIYLVLAVYNYRAGQLRVRPKLTAKKKDHLSWTKLEMRIFSLIAISIVTIGLSKLMDLSILISQVSIIAVYILIIIFMVIIMYKLLSHTQPGKIVAEGDPSEISRIRNLIEQRQIFSNDALTIAVLADQLDMAPAKLSALINNQFGAPFNQFINQIRIDYAKKELLKTDTPIKAIMYDAGFNSRSVFNEAFKRVTNKSPSQYRKMGKDS